MIWNGRRDEYTLSSGRTFYANGGVLGIGSDCEHVMEGWDGGARTDDWTPEERRELADEMKRRWERFAEGDHDEDSDKVA